MYGRFPVELLELLRCFHGRGRLVAAGRETRISEGILRCECCGRDHRISGGILSLLDESSLDSESANEMRIRDRGAQGDDSPVADLGAMDAAETVPTLAELQPSDAAAVLELGCGTGRYTLPISGRCGLLLAVDFSRDSLVALARKLPDDPRIGLVQADVTRLLTAAGAFDRILSTLVSNLPTDAHRAAMYLLGARALRKGGRFVFSTHNYGVREVLRRAPIEGPYSSAYPVYRRLFSPAEIVSESSRYFRRVRCRPVQIVLPFTRAGWFPIVSFSRAAERVPGLNRFARILLFTAEDPVSSRPAAADER